MHRLVRISPFDAQHRRQTSFASLDVVPFLEDVSGEVEIDEKDLRIDTYRSSGAGGQHVNKTDSAVRLTHLPTGIVVSCQNQRSQHQNKAKAMQVLGAKLAERQRAEHQATLDQLAGDRTDNAWGNQIRSYVMAPYQLVNDHRNDAETGNVEAVLDGDLDGFIEAELRRQAEKRRRRRLSACRRLRTRRRRRSEGLNQSCAIGGGSIDVRMEAPLCDLSARLDCEVLLMITFQNVTKTYKGSTVALNDCSVEIDKGEFVFLVGPSGSGKTTFIRLLLREEVPDSGRIWEAGKEIGHLAKWRIPYLRRNIGCVFQDFRLLPNKSVFENVAFALEVIGRPKHVIATQVPQVLDLVGLTKKRDNLPHELSGGEQQRVAVARAFVNRPLILLADEPTGNLDPDHQPRDHEAARPDQPHRDDGDRRHPRRRHGGPDAPAGHRARPRPPGAGPGPRRLRDRQRHRRRRGRVAHRDRWSSRPPRSSRPRVPRQLRRPYLMPVSAGYVSREAATNLWRNRLMTVAAILTVAVSLALVGSSLLLKQGASQGHRAVAERRLDHRLGEAVGRPRPDRRPSGPS